MQPVVIYSAFWCLLGNAAVLFYLDIYQEVHFYL